MHTQVGRALAQLGIGHIAAYSPEARGRSERAFRTLQDRLPKELGLAGITNLEAANRWLAESYFPAHNAAFAVAPPRPAPPSLPTAPAPARDPVHPGGTPGRQRQHRQMARVCSANPAEPARPHFVRASVRVHEYPDGRLAVFLGPHRLADYDPDDNPCDGVKLAA